MLSQVIRFPKGILWAHGGGLNAMDGLALSLIKAVFGLILPPVKAVFGLVHLPVNVEGVSTTGTRGGGWWRAEGMLSMIMTGSSSEGSTTACFAFFVPKLLVFAFLTISFFITFPEDISLAKYASTCNYLQCILSHTIARLWLSDSAVGELTLPADDFSFFLARVVDLLAWVPILMCRG